MEGPSIPQRQLVNELEPTETDQNGQEESHVNPEIQNQNGLHSDANSTDADEHTHENGQESSAPSVLEDLVSTGEWSCPPFSYRQDECSVTFVLHTPNVKENSFVANFDQRFVSSCDCFDYHNNYIPLYLVCVGEGHLKKGTYMVALSHLKCVVPPPMAIIM